VTERSKVLRNNRTAASTFAGCARRRWKRNKKRCSPSKTSAATLHHETSHLPHAGANPPSFLTASTASFRICDFLLNLKFIFCLMSCAVILLCIDVLSVPMYRPQCSPPGPGGIFKTCCAYHRRRFVDTHTRANYIPEHFLTVCFMQESLPCLSSSKPH